MKFTIYTRTILGTAAPFKAYSMPSVERMIGEVMLRFPIYLGRTEAPDVSDRWIAWFRSPAGAVIGLGIDAAQLPVDGDGLPDREKVLKPNRKIALFPTFVRTEPSCDLSPA